MRRFFIILSLIIFTTDTFAACSAGYYEQSVDFTAPTSSANSCGHYSHDGGRKSNNTSPVNLSAGQWRVTWTSSGTAVGEASCNSTSGSTSPWSTAPSDSMSNSANGQYCWCKVTQWIPNSGSSQALPAAWVFRVDYGSADKCANSCAWGCGSNVQVSSGLRSAVFGAVATSTCTACPAKPSNATWTTDCNYACPAGTFKGITKPTGTPSSYYPNGITGYTYTTWNATWNDGDTPGVAAGQIACNTVVGVAGQAVNDDFAATAPSSSSSNQCWCRITSWTPSGGSAVNVSAKWVYVAQLSSCSSRCASRCVYTGIKEDPTFRTAIFNAVDACTTCPSGGTSTAGATEITQCYIPTTTTMTDAAGTYTFSSNCYYSE